MLYAEAPRQKPSIIPLAEAKKPKSQSPAHFASPVASTFSPAARGSPLRPVPRVQSMDVHCNPLFNEAGSNEASPAKQDVRRWASADLAAAHHGASPATARAAAAWQQRLQSPGRGSDSIPGTSTPIPAAPCEQLDCLKEAVVSMGDVACFAQQHASGC